MEQEKKIIPTNYGALSTLVVVFFFWGFIAAGNGVFIPFCKHYFNLDQFQSQLIDFAFYFAYYVGALLLFIYSNFTGKDLVSTWGYRRSIVYGLGLSAIGAIAMIIAVNANTFPGMLLGYFMVAFGFSLQQTAANPFALSLGDPASGANRINLGGSINSFGTFIGPIVVALVLFGVTKSTDEQIEHLNLGKVSTLYAFVCALFLAAALLFYFSKKVPDGISESKTETANKAFIALLIMTILMVAMFVPVFQSYRDVPADEVAKKAVEMTRSKWLSGALFSIVATLLISYFMANKKSEGWGAMKYPQLVLGMLAIFVYVGVEVTVGSNLSELLKQPQFGGYDSAHAAAFVAMYWGSLMIGRWAGAINVFKPTEVMRKVLMVLVPLVAFGILIGINSIVGNDIDPLMGYIFCVAVLVISFFITNDKPAFTLLVFSVLGMVAMVIGLMTEGRTAVYAFLSGGLFCSVMWPCIFSLSTAGLGKFTTQGSGFLIMMILGGAVIPPMQGKLSDLLQSSSTIQGSGIHQSYWMAVICFAYLALFAFLVKGILKKQGINYDAGESGGH